MARLRCTFRPRWTHQAIFFLDVFIRSLTREKEVEDTTAAVLMVDKYGGKDTPGNMAAGPAGTKRTSQSSYVVALSSSMYHALLDVPACYAGYRQPCIDQAPGAN